MHLFVWIVTENETHLVAEEEGDKIIDFLREVNTREHYIVNGIVHSN
jgi:hypothetical protein